MKTKRKWSVRKRFSYHIKEIEKLIIKHVGENNYAGESSLSQLDRIYEKFMDCTDRTD